MPPPPQSESDQPRVPTEHAHVLERHGDEVYVHYVNTDKRLDEWIAQRDVRPAGTHEADAPSGGASRKRKRGSANANANGEGSVSASRHGSPSSRDSRLGSASGSAQPEMQNASASVITEEEYDIEHHKQITAKRNFDKVTFGRWQIKTWCVFLTSTLLVPILHITSGLACCSCSVYVCGVYAGSIVLNVTQVLLALSSDRVRDRRHRDTKLAHVPYSWQDTRRGAFFHTLAWPYFRPSCRWPRSQPWHWPELDPVGLRSMLQIHGRRPLLGIACRA